MKTILGILGFTAGDGKPNWGGIGAWCFALLFIIGGATTEEPLAIVWGGVCIIFFIGMNFGAWWKNKDSKHWNN